MSNEKPTDPNDAKSMTDNSISMYIHCGKCLQDFKDDAPGTDGKSPSTYSQLEIGWTLLGIQVWCRRHECNVVHVDFEGEKHPAA